MRRVHPFWPILLLALFALTACTRDETAVSPRDERAASSADQADAASLCGGAEASEPSDRLMRLPPDRAPAPPRITQSVQIAGETRRALGGPRSRPVGDALELALPRDVREPSRRRIDLGQAFLRDAKRVALVPRVQKQPWPALAPIVLDVVRDDSGPHVDAELDLRALGSRRGRVRLELIGYPLPADAVTHRMPPALRVPDGEPWLSTAVGVREPARGQGPVRFRLSVCERGECRCVAQVDVDPTREGWVPIAVSMAAYAGREVRLRYESKVASPGPGAFDLGQWAVPRWLAPRSPGGPGRHDVLVISIDTLGADHLESYGYARETSPFTSSVFAPRGAVLEQVMAPATTTAPSHMSLFTSLQPSVHGVASNLRETGLPAGVPTLASVLRDAGFVTGSFNENGAIVGRHGFDRGFDEYVELKGATRRSPHMRAEEVFRRGADFVRRHASERWMLFLHTYAVHDPYTPSEEFARLWPEGDAEDHPDNAGMSAWRGEFRPVLYDREIRQLDALLERFVGALEAKGLLDDAIVVLTSDHGEAFFEHGLLGHGGDVHQETVHVPVVVVGPGIRPGRRVEVPASLIDLMPTLLELVGVAAPEGLTGRSLAALLRGEAADASWLERSVVSETWHPWARTVDGRVPADPPTIAVRRGRLKLIRRAATRGPAESLFDLEADPFERVDLLAGGGAADLEDEVEEELEALRAAADGYAATSAATAEALGLPAFDPRPTDETKLSPERREALRALGYIE